MPAGTKPGPIFWRGVLMRHWGVTALVLLLLVVPLPARAGESGDPAPGTVGLTFDDGPDPKWTPIILDILDEYGATVTFFVLGWKVDRYPELVAEIARRGHSIQPHGYTHGVFTKRSDRSLRETLNQTKAAIFNATGLVATCVRPPQGASSERVRRVAAEVGLDVVIWDVNSLDYSLQASKPVVRHTVSRTEAGDNILAHDIWGSIWDTALPALLESFIESGFGFDTVCENTLPFSKPPYATWQRLALRIN
jgi:peptidoglycan/xylan/chitin deacetylase (PgdA/CDA1 family)